MSWNAKGYARYALLLIGGFCLAHGAPSEGATRTLAFQIFTGADASSALEQNIPPQPADLHRTIRNLRDRIGVPSSSGRRLGFVLGPIALDHSDDQVRALVSEGFDIALETGVAVGFHIDDSMFWGRLTTLNAPENLEWLDWRGTPNGGRRLDWSAQPTKIMPQLCFNSTGVVRAVTTRAALIGHEVRLGLERLRTARKEELFLGVIAGWETQIGRDFDSGKSLGYCALTNAGYSYRQPPTDPDTARASIVAEFIALWARSLVAGGVPKGAIYSHIAFTSLPAYRANPAGASYLQTINFAPPATAFCDDCVPGLTTYPQPGHLEQWRAELTTRGDQPWASCEGTAIDPAQAGRSGSGTDMEGYLGRLYNSGAVLVNLFGWSVGAADNPFRTAAEGPKALEAYRKFLRGAPLTETALGAPAAGLADKIHQLQALLPAWVRIHGAARIQNDLNTLEDAIRSRDSAAASEAADAILKVVER